MARFYDFVQDALAEGQPFALGIIAGIKGSSPQKKGAKALFFADGRGAERSGFQIECELNSNVAGQEGKAHK